MRGVQVRAKLSLILIAIFIAITSINGWAFGADSASFLEFMGGGESETDNEKMIKFAEITNKTHAKISENSEGMILVGRGVNVRSLEFTTADGLRSASTTQDIRIKHDSQRIRLLVPAVVKKNDANKIKDFVAGLGNQALKLFAVKEHSMKDDNILLIFIYSDEEIQGNPLYRKIDQDDDFSILWIDLLKKYYKSK